MNTRELLEEEARKRGILIKNIFLPEDLSGLYFSDGKNQPVIAINSVLDTTSEHCCVIAEELGHHFTSYGDILTDNSDIDNITKNKQEIRARNWSYEKLLPLDSLILAYNISIKNRFELSEFLGVTEQFIGDALSYYYQKYGQYIELNDYCIYFNPLVVFKKIP